MQCSNGEQGGGASSAFFARMRRLSACSGERRLFGASDATFGGGESSRRLHLGDVAKSKFHVGQQPAEFAHPLESRFAPAAATFAVPTKTRKPPIIVVAEQQKDDRKWPEILQRRKKCSRQQL